MSEFTESVQHYCEGFTVATGPAASCGECLSAYGIDDSGDIDEMQAELYQHDCGGFSSSQCDSCGSMYAGDRFEAHLIAHERNSAGEYDCIHATVCVDCLMYHANGEEPAEWYQTPADYREAVGL